jgi:hypothetical protein
MTRNCHPEFTVQGYIRQKIEFRSQNSEDEKFNHEIHETNENEREDPGKNNFRHFRHFELF